MRKVEKDMIQALIAGTAMGSRNTTVTAPDSDGVQRVFLHGHEIATYYRETGTLDMSLCGWNTTTTRSRLNALACAFGVEGFSQRDFAAYHGERMIDPSDKISTRVVRPTLPTWVR